MENIVECMTAIINTPLIPDRVSQVIDCSTELDMEASPDLRTCRTKLCRYLIQDFCQWESDYTDPQKQPTFHSRGMAGKVYKVTVPIHGSIAIKIQYIPDLVAFRNEIKYAMGAAKHHIGPEIYDYYICNSNAPAAEEAAAAAETVVASYGIIVMKLLDGYVLSPKYLRIIKGSNPTTKSFVVGHFIPNITQQFEIIKKVLVDKLQINIPDFQFMIHPDTHDVQVIDFGFTIPMVCWFREDRRAVASSYQDKIDDFILALRKSCTPS